MKNLIDDIMNKQAEAIAMDIDAQIMKDMFLELTREELDKYIQGGEYTELAESYFIECL